MSIDLDLKTVEKTERIERKQFKNHDRLTLIFPKGGVLKKTVWNLRGRYHELPEPLFEAIKEKIAAK